MGSGKRPRSKPRWLRDQLRAEKAERERARRHVAREQLTLGIEVEALGLVDLARERRRRRLSGD